MESVDIPKLFTDSTDSMFNLSLNLSIGNNLNSAKSRGYHASGRCTIVGKVTVGNRHDDAVRLTSPSP